MTRNAERIEVGDKMRVSFALLRAILAQSPAEGSTLVVRVNEIRTEDDGTKTLIVGEAVVTPC